MGCGMVVIACERLCEDIVRGLFVCGFALLVVDLGLIYFLILILVKFGGKGEYER